MTMQGGNFDVLYGDRMREGCFCPSCSHVNKMHNYVIVQMVKGGNVRAGYYHVRFVVTTVVLCSSIDMMEIKCQSNHLLCPSNARF